MPKIDLYNDDCFNILKTISDNSIDMICTDPPYGTTTIAWDELLDFNSLWLELERVVKPKAPIIFFGSQPFTSLMITSKVDWFRHELIWNKNKCGSPGLAKFRPQKVHENIMVFSKEGGHTYNPIMEEGEPFVRESKNPDGYGAGINGHKYGFKKMMGGVNEGTRYPKSILHASRNFSAQQTIHPTQKPTNILNWLIMTYSNPGETVLDLTMGSGSCGVSAKMTGRNFIGIEKDKAYFDIAESRITEADTDCVLREDRQLTTQLHPDMKTTPESKYEKGKLEKIRQGDLTIDENKQNLDNFFDFK